MSLEEELESTLGVLRIVRLGLQLEELGSFLQVSSYSVVVLRLLEVLLPLVVLKLLEVPRKQAVLQLQVLPQS